MWISIWSRVGTDRSGRNLKFWPKAAAGEATEAEWKEFVKVGFSFPSFQLILKSTKAYVDSSDLENNPKHYLKETQVERLSAGVDYPISLFWKDLIKMYPNAKVHFICCFWYVLCINVKFIPTQVHTGLSKYSSRYQYVSLNENRCCWTTVTLSVGTSPWRTPSSTWSPSSATPS